jgi:hypothetical protein
MRAKGRSLPTSNAHLISFQFSFQLFSFSHLLVMSEYIMSSLHLQEVLFDSFLFIYQCRAVNACIQEFVEICKWRALMDASSEYGILQFMDTHSASVGALKNIKVWGGRLCSWPNYMTWFSNDDHTLIIVTKMCAEHVTTDPNFMEWPCPCSLCWVQNRLIGTYPNYVGCVTGSLAPYAT